MKRAQQKLYEGNFIKNAFTNAKDWIKNKAKDVKRNSRKVLNYIKKEYLGPKRASNFEAGKMLAMNYRAKDTKQRYDANPLIICLGPPQNPKLSKTHTLGLNFHWLPAQERVALASYFTELNKKRGGKLTYQDVAPFMSKFKGHKVLRMYIIKNIGNKVIEIPTEQFLTASSIPSEKWVGG